MSASPDVIHFVSALLVVGGGLVLYMGLAPLLLARQVRRRLGGMNGAAAETPGAGAMPRAERIGHALLAATGLHGTLERLTRGAGRFSRTAPYRLASASALTAVLAGTLALAYGIAAIGSPWRQGVLTLFTTLAGGLLPLSIMASRRKARLRQLRRELPFVLDVLVIILRSGNSLEQCFRQFLALGPMSFPETYRTVEVLIAEIETGKPYPDAFEHWARLLYIPAGQSLAALFTQALIHGTAIVPSLEQVTATLIDERSQAARQAAGSRLPALTAIMLVFLLPPMLAIIALPAASQLMTALEGL
jgi:tight adherence protein C